MLPWRRKTLVLVEEEGRSKGRSFSYSSILSSLLRSCPSLLPAGPPPWVGRLLHSRRQKVELNKEEPVYTVRYLGSVVTFTAKGEDCTREAVERIWARSGFGEQSVKMNLSVGAHGLRLSSDKKKKKKNPAHLYSLSRITHCGADPARTRILAWVYRHQVRNLAVVLRCHAVLLSRPEQAEAVSVSLDQSSSSAFSEFKRLKRLSDHRHVQTQLLGGGVPLMPLRRVLNGQCHYRTPADRTLCSSPLLLPERLLSGSRRTCAGYF